MTEGLLSLMRDEVRARGANFLVVTTTNTTQVDPDLSVRQRMMDKLGVKTLSYPDDRIKAFGEREGFDVVNLAPPMQDLVKRTGVYFHGFANTPKGAGHWNQEGHRVVAELLRQGHLRAARRELHLEQMTGLNAKPQAALRPASGG